MTRFLGTLVALAVVILLVLPFAREGYHRYELGRRLSAVMDPKDRAAFQEWNGDAQSFGRSLLERCELGNGNGAPVCQRYRLALQ